MAIINQPDLLTSAIAANGDKNTIPNTANSTQGFASISEGFPQITSQPIAAGGVPPRREDFNGLFNLISQFLLYYQNGGVGKYNSTLDYAPMQIAAHNNTIWMCIKQNGANTSVGVIEPNSNNTEYWQELGGGLMTGATASVAGRKGTVPAPSAGQQANVLSGAGTWVNKVANATNADVATKLGSATVGSTSKPIYLNNGTATALSATVGSTSKPIYLNGGTLTASNATIGSQDTPVYLNGGTLTACRASLGIGGGVIAQSLGTNGYVKFSNGLILQWGVYTTAARNTTITFPIAFASACYSVVACIRTTNSTGASGSQCVQYVSNISKTNFQTGSYDYANGVAGGFWYATGK